MRTTAVLRSAKWITLRCLVVITACLVTALVSASAAWAGPAAAPGSLPAAYHQSCLPDGTVRVAFSWTPYHDFQWLDLSLADNGFAPGTFVSVGPMILVSSTPSFTWGGIAPGRLHVARVNTLTVHGWEASQTSRFVTRTCATSSAAQLAPGSPDQCIAMTFQWAPANPEGQVQWIDLSTANNGFAPGTYVHAGPFSGGVSSFYWTGLQPGTRHYWRVNTWTGSGWISSATGSFSTPATLPATTADAERILGAAVKTIKGRDLPVFLAEEATGAPLSSYWVDQAIAMGGRAYYGTYDGCLNRIIVVEAPGGDGSLTELVEPMTESPATWSEAAAQLKQLFPGAGPAFGRQMGTGNVVYLFHDEGATISYSVLAGLRGAAVIAASGSYKHLTPRCC